MASWDEGEEEVDDVVDGESVEGVRLRRRVLPVDRPAATSW